MLSMRHASPITGNNVVSRAQPPPGNDEVSTCFNQSQAAPCPIVLNQSFPYNRPALNRMYVVIARPPHMCLHSHFHAGNQENRAALQRRIRRARRNPIALRRNLACITQQAKMLAYKGILRRTPRKAGGVTTLYKTCTARIRLRSGAISA